MRLTHSFASARAALAAFSAPRRLGDATSGIPSCRALTARRESGRMGCAATTPRTRAPALVASASPSARQTNATTGDASEDPSPEEPL